ncbi:hypothetical protein FRC08_011025 [Ceratobasidium sp. 394]|nr:hypothetical protein FRC08_011025 [Ceratobasidium sp. 394]
MSFSQSNANSVPQMMTYDSHPARMRQIVDAVSRTRKMMILCGDVAARELSLPGLDESVDVCYGEESRRAPLRSLIRDLKPTRESPAENQNRFMVASLNLAMAERRVAARSAQPGAFSGFISRMNQIGKLALCATTGFDGLEAAHDPLLAEKMVMLHGDNRQLRCYRRACKGLPEDEVGRLDSLLLSMDNLGEGDRARLCTNCWKSYIKASKQARVGNQRTHSLRPAVDVDVAEDMMSGEGKGLMMRAAEQCQLLLIVGTSLKSQRLRELTQDLADVIHARSGAVVYVYQERLKGRNLFNHIDFHLGLDTATMASHVLGQLEQPSTSSSSGLEPVYNEEDFWFEMVNNDVVAAARKEEEPYAGPLCRGCGCGIEEYLVSCQNCGHLYCCRRVNYDESDAAPQKNDGTVVPIDIPDEGDDPFELQDACVVLNLYSKDGKRPRLAEAKREFVCPYCWNRETLGLYPHYVRPGTRLIMDHDEAKPRMAMVIYYVEQFWPHAKHLTTLVAARWESKGWPDCLGASPSSVYSHSFLKCFVQPVKLEHMSESVVFQQFPFEADSYELFVVYLTHGLTGDQGYQMAHGEAVQPVPFLERTVDAAGNIYRQASSRRAFVLCCAHPLSNSGFVAGMRQWMDSDAGFDSLLASMNLRLSPAYLVNLVAKITTGLVEQAPWAAETMFRMWLADSIAPSHSDMLLLARKREPELWLYAPFQSRPLGKPLPNVLAVCSCPGLSGGGTENKVLRRAGGRKVWDVRQTNGKDGTPLRDVRVQAACLVCRQSWPLPSEHMDGVLRKYFGTFGAVVPYFPRSS